MPHERCVAATLFQRPEFHTSDAVSQRNALYFRTATPLSGLSSSLLSYTHALRRRALSQRTVLHVVLIYMYVAQVQPSCDDASPVWHLSNM